MKKYPYKGFPDKITVNFFLPVIKGIIPILINYSHKILKNFNINSGKYSQVPKEIHRVLSLAEERSTEKHIKEKIRNIRDLLCLILEYDDFYRLIFQDIAEELKIEKLLLDEDDKICSKFKSKRYHFGGKNNN